LAIAIVIVPVSFGMPAVLVLIPPLVALTPASFPCSAQLATLVFGALALGAVSFYGTVQIVLGADDPSLATVVIFCMKLRNGGEQQNPSNDR
jgi:hypothetical protein